MVEIKKTGSEGVLSFFACLYTSAGKFILILQKIRII